MEEDTILASIDIANGVEGVSPCDLLILADGVPVSFLVDGERYQYYHMDVIGYQRIDAEISAEFSLNIGRLDFYVLNENGPDEVSFILRSR